MKTIIKTVAVLASTAVLAGCVVTSVYPFYTVKDVVFDPALLGAWAEADSTNAANEHWRFEKAENEAYVLTVHEVDKHTEFDAHLFKLRGVLFLDLLPRERPDNSLPLHYLLKVNRIAPSLDWTLLDYDWLSKLVEKDPKAIRHMLVPKKLGETGNGDFVLTADTAELQRFILKHVNTQGAFPPGKAMRRWHE
jgi:hypothetical protein